MGMTETRAGGEQILFREINERIRVLATDDYSCFLCECANLNCIETIEVPLGEYEQVRRVPTHFVVRPEHVIRDVELVVASGPGYVVVEKFGAAAFAPDAAAAAEVPRSEVRHR